MASQQNGHDFDNEMKAVFGVTSANYTARHDIPEELNGGNFASVKSSVGDSCDCGDALRMYENTELPNYHLIRGRFQQVGEQKHLKEIHHFNLSNSKEIMWGQVTREDVLRLRELTGSYRPGMEEIRKNVHKLKNELNKKSGFMKFRPKMDSKQHRLQCSIPEFAMLVKSHPSRIIAHTLTGIFNGIQLMLIRESGRRIRAAHS